MKQFKGVQQDILLANKKNQLVSAGAGSGKTTVMIEKISRLLLNGEVNIDELLVVTFTVLAAQEMKERLIKKLKDEIGNAETQEKERILNIIEKINTASIDTIDGFNSKTIKKYFYELEISPNIEIISDATKDYYVSKAIKKTFDEYAKVSGDINLMLDLFGGNGRNLDTLKELILSSYYNVINLENYEGFLSNCNQEYLDTIKSEKVLNEHILLLANKITKAIIEESALFTNRVKDKLSTIVEMLNKFNVHVSLKSNLRVLNKLEVFKFTPTEYKENVGLKLLVEKINDLNDLKNNLEKNKINENFEEINEKIIKYLTIFLELLKNFIKDYNKIKEKNNLIDFNDLSRLMLKLLKNENIKQELQQQFKYVFIDEYQDVNPLQDFIMSELVGENTTVFMVGDVKQSIYGFRGSSPEWFLQKYNNMKKNKTQEDVFDMNVNFRSSPIILKFINEVFSLLMTKEIADIDYAKDCEIEPQRDDIVDDKVKILLVEEEKETDFDKGVYSVKNHIQKQAVKAKNKEAELVLKIITELIGTDFYDANIKETRKLTYSDIAILTHSDKDENSKILIDLLKANAVPLNLNNKLEVDNSEIVKLILSILKCVCGTADDVDYLAAFLSLTDLSVDDVVYIRDKNFSFYENLLKNQEKLTQNDDKDEIFSKIKQGFDVLADIANASFSKTNRELISYILNEKRLRYYILRKINGEKELNLLEEFLQKLSPVEDALGVAEFIEVVESNVSSSGDFISIDKEDSVTLQTIHKSKGLEYPVVILFNSSKLFSYLRENDAINFNSNIGFGLDYFDTANRIKMDSLTKFAIRLENNKKGYKEELRLLYVALTRAKNKLFITGTITNKDFSNINKTSYTNMILSCFGEQIVDDKLEKENFVLEILKEIDATATLSVANARQVDVVGEDFVYPHKHKFNIPLKNTVTGINSEKHVVDGFSVKNVFNTTMQYEAENRALTGINYHTALQMLNFTINYQKNTDFSDVDYAKIRLAHEKLRPLVENAINIEKEAEFMMYVPYNKVVESDVEDKVLIQGVVDLLIEKENSIILVDYKFSTLPAKILKNKYMEQLKLYKMAIEEAYNKPVEQMYIYSIITGELI